jgi:hypothetical protein
MRGVELTLLRMLDYVADVPIWNYPFNMTIEW